MKKYTSKIMMGFSALFSVNAIYIVSSVLTENMRWHRNETKFALLAVVALAGLFLGLSRIIELLEKQTH